MTRTDWVRWAGTLPVDGPGPRLVSSPVPADDNAVRDRAAALHDLGYVVVSSDRQVDASTRRQLRHRHVALLVPDTLDVTGRAWLRELASASVRAHLVIHCGVSGSEVPSVARERAVAWSVSTSSADPRRARAHRLMAAGRPQAALSWLQAAVAVARRRSDEWHLARLLAEYAHAAITTSGSAHTIALARCRRALVDVHGTDARSQVVAAVAALLMPLGRLAEAVALLAGADIEHQLTDLDVPSCLVSAQMDAALWRGRWDDAWTAAHVLASGAPDDVGRVALIAWLRHDQAGVGRLAPRLRALTGGGWACVGALVGAIADGDAVRVRAGADIALRDRSVVWTRALAVEALRGVGAPAEAEALLHRARRACVAGSLEEVLLAHLAGDRRAADAAAHAGAQGVRRWGERRTSMSTWGGVSALLDEVNDAEDDGAALRRGCRWVRAHTGSAHVCVLSAETGLPVIAEPDGARPDGDDVRAAVRQGGITIGWVSAARRARDAEELAGCVRALAAACAPAVRARLDQARVQASGDALASDLLGQSPSMVALRAAIARAAPTTFPVLIEGESGVGKELVARALHRLSGRRDRRLAAINCAALTDDLFEAEVFGHTRGAFTGAVTARTGLFEEAHHGTLFLDEVGELSPRGQAKLLRVLQEGEIRRVGDNQPRAVDVRVVAATNRPLAAAAATGAYREDLLFRLAVVRLVVTPLRERLEDVPALAQAFWVRAGRHRETRAWLAPDALAALCRHHWPGNIRELQNVVAGLVLAAPVRGRVTARHVHTLLEAHHAGAGKGPVALGEARRALDHQLVTTALARHAGCRIAAARDLGVSRQGLAKLMARLAIDPAAVASNPTLR